jgi:hypothetical protein
MLTKIRAAFEGATVAEKNIALRLAHDEIERLLVARDLPASKMRDNANAANAIAERIRSAIHLESAAIAPQTSALIEAARMGADEIERLRAIAPSYRSALLRAEREARVREVAEVRALKDAWIDQLEAENRRLRTALEQAASIAFNGVEEEGYPGSIDRRPVTLRNAIMALV